MKTHPIIAALCCAFALVLSGWTGLPAHAQNQSIDLTDTVAAYMALAEGLANDDVHAAQAAARQMDLALVGHAAN